MSSPESLPTNESDPRLAEILDQYGDILVMNHKDGGYLPLSQAVDSSSPNYCPPFVHVLLSAESPQQLQQIVDLLKPSE